MNWAKTSEATLVLVKRAPQPFYTNSDQTEPELGDIAQHPNGQIRWAAEITRGDLAWWRWDGRAGMALYVDTSDFTREGPLTLLGKAAG